MTFDLDLATLDRGCKWVRGGGNVDILLMVRDLEGALGKRLWTSGRGLGGAWTRWGPGDVRGRFGG